MFKIQVVLVSGDVFQHGGASGGYDMNVVGAWHKGYTGKGVVVTILDDGIEYTHHDLKHNYVSTVSHCQLLLCGQNIYAAGYVRGWGTLLCMLTCQ